MVEIKEFHFGLNAQCLMNGKIIWNLHFLNIDSVILRVRISVAPDMQASICNPCGYFQKSIYNCSLQLLATKELDILKRDSWIYKESLLITKRR